LHWTRQVLHSFFKNRFVEITFVLEIQNYPTILHRGYRSVTAGSQLARWAVSVEAEQEPELAHRRYRDIIKTLALGDCNFFAMYNGMLFEFCVGQSSKITTTIQVLNRHQITTLLVLHLK
jgi:hypothetical protein